MFKIILKSILIKYTIKVDRDWRDEVKQVRNSFNELLNLDLIYECS